MNCPDNQCTIGIPIKSSSPLNEFSFCGKYRFKILKKSLLMYMDGPNSFIDLYDFEEEKGFIRHNGISKIFSFKNQTLVPDQWQHICMAVTYDGKTILVLNGEIVYKASLKGDSTKIETNLWLGGSNVSSWKHRRLEGAMTDIHLWNKSLNMDDLILITKNRKTSDSIAATALFSWKTFKKTASCQCIEYQTLDENDNLFKDNFKEEAIVLIEHEATFDSANHFCKGFGGELLVPQNGKDVGLVHALIKKRSDI